MSEYSDRYTKAVEIIGQYIIKPTYDDYKRILEQMGLNTIRIRKPTGLDIIIDLNSIRPPKYYIKKNLGVRGGYDPPSRMIYMDMKLLYNYYSPNGRFQWYHTAFHETTHYYRHTIYISIHELNSKFPIDSFIEELTTESITNLLLSKKFRKDMIKNEMRRVIVSGFGENIHKYVDGNNKFYLYFNDDIYLPYDLGCVLTSIFLNTTEDIQREFLKKMFLAYTKEDLETSLRDLWAYIPQDNITTSYYNLVMDIIKGTPIQIIKRK